MSAGLRIVQERRGHGTSFWTLEIVGGTILPTDIDDFTNDLRAAVTTVDHLNQRAKNRDNP